MDVCTTQKKKKGIKKERKKKFSLWIDRNESLVYEALSSTQLDELSTESGDGCSPGSLLNQKNKIKKLQLLSTAVKFL